MQKNIPLSIAIPSYNRGIGLRSLLDSVAAQSIAGDNLFVSDDASTDDTARVVASIPAFRLIQQPSNVGMVRNWNFCLKQANCDWICIIHDDDSLEPGGLEVLRNACAIAGQPALILSTEKQTECDETFRYSFWSPGLWAILHCPTIPSGAVVHRKIVDKLGVFNPKFSYSPDLEYFPRIAAQFPVVIIESPVTVRYKLHDLNYQVKTWKRADFVAQLEEIQRLIVSYAGINGASAESLVQHRLKSNLEYILKEGYRRRDNFLIQQYTELLESPGKGRKSLRLFGFLKKILRA